MKRKILSLILVFAMTVSLLTVGTGAVEPAYGDTAGHWAESSIERWSGHGIIQGSNGLFDPNGQLTCAQLATILAKLLKLPAAKDAGFTDNTADAWYYDAVNRCAAAGILNGNGDGTVTPEAPITRERAMVMLARALGIEPIREPDLTKYTDAAKVAPYAQGMVAAMIEAGIVGGVTADELAPQDNINRASTVTILDRAISTYADKAGATVKADGKGIVLVVADDVTVTGNVDKLLVPADNVDVTVSGSKNIDDITVTGDNSKVILNNSTANDVTLDGKNTELETKSGSKVENVSVTEDAKGATVNAGSGTTIGTVDSKADNVSISGDGKVENASVSGDNTKVNTKDTKVDVDEGVTGTTAGGKEVAGGTTTETKPSTPSGGGSVHSHSYDAETLKCACGQFRDDVVATVGDTHGYTTLVAAVNAVLSTESKTGTVKLLKNATGSGIALKNGNGATDVNLTIDFGGNTYTFTDPAVGSSGTETQGFHFEKDNTVVLKNGTLDVAAESTKTKMLIQNYCDLTLDGMKVYGNTNTNVDYVASNNNGNIIIKDTTITANTDKCALDVYSFGSYTGANVTITGTSEINGKIEVGYSSDADTSKLGLTIKSGKINGAIVQSGAADDAFLKAHIAITGGTFSSDPGEYLANGFTASENNGVWTLSDPVAQIGDTYYGGLYEAVEACKSSETIELLCDLKLDKTNVTYGGWANCATGTLKGTLNGNNHTITLEKGLFFGAYFGSTYMYNPCLKNVNIVANNGSVYVQAYNGSFENVKVSGSIEVSNNTGAYVIFGSPYYGALTFKNCEMAATMYGEGTAKNYDAAFVGYGMGTGVQFNFENCKMTGSLTCGVAAVFLGNDSQLGGNWKVNVSNFTFGEDAVVRNTLTSGYNWKFNGIVAANNAPGTPVVTIDSTEYSGKDGFTQLVDTKNTIWAAKHFAYGPKDNFLKLTKSVDGTFTITPAETEGVAKYVVTLAVYSTLKEGGSGLQSVSETITNLPESGDITTALKDLKFIDETWLANNSDAVPGELAGNTIYTLDDESYYMITDNNLCTLNGNPKAAQVYGVTAYDANNVIVASAPLTVG